MHARSLYNEIVGMGVFTDVSCQTDCRVRTDIRLLECGKVLYSLLVINVACKLFSFTVNINSITKMEDSFFIILLYFLHATLPTYNTWHIILLHYLSIHYVTSLTICYIPYLHEPLALGYKTTHNMWKNCNDWFKHRKLNVYVITYCMHWFMKPDHFFE